MAVEEYFKEGLGRGIEGKHLILSRFLCSRFSINNDRQLFMFIAAASILFESGHLRIEIDTVHESISTLFLSGSDKQSDTGNYILASLGSQAEIRKLLNRYDVLFRNEEEDSREWRSPFIVTKDIQYIYTEKLYNREKGFLKNLCDFIAAPGKYKPMENFREAVLPDFIESESGIRLEKKQLDAVFLALEKKLAVIAGGPGTGKTTTIIAVIKALLEASDKNLPLIALAAPTGRAAKRMEEMLENSNLSGRVEKPATLHRLLYQKYSTGILPHDIIIVDECSMIDINMINMLFESVKKESSIILVGDPDQLPAVGTGTVFSDMLTNIELPEHMLNSYFTRLETVKRSEDEISRFAELVRKGGPFDTDKSENSSIKIFPLSEKNIISTIKSLYSDGNSLKEEYLEKIRDFAVLTPLNTGAFGIEQLNRKTAQSLGHRDRLYFDKMPVMITRNDYENSLFNGERGVVYLENNQYYCLFKKGDSSSREWRSYPITALKEWEMSYVQTIHKSQGNEFNTVVIIIDSYAERMLTREMLYTAVTRARKEVILFTTFEILDKAAGRKITRNSGISRAMTES